MNQQRFEELWQEQWRLFGDLLTLLESGGKNSRGVDPHRFPDLYRQTCNHYGLARCRHYSPSLVDHLHQLVLRGHRQLYRSRHGGLRSLYRFLAFDFPVTLRRHYRLFWLALMLFLVPAVGAGILCHRQPAAIYTLMNEYQVAEMESMYDPANREEQGGFNRESRSEFMMFGYYIFNNISIGFRTFAGGILYGAGSVLLLIFNGMIIGGVAGHLSHVPFGAVFWPFVVGHGAFELTAIVICGASGLLLGSSLIKPGGLRRRDALRMAAPKALLLVLGAALMLVLAAAIEAFWSSSSLPAGVKYPVAAGNWLLVTCYLIFTGRRRD